MDDVRGVTPEKEAIILDALHEKPTYANAARKARITYRTLLRWRQADPAFDARVQAARHAGFDAVEDRLIDRGMKDDTTALIFLLKGWRPERYRDRLDAQLTGKDGAPLLVVIGQREDGPG